MLAAILHLVAMVVLSMAPLLLRKALFLFLFLGYFLVIGFQNCMLVVDNFNSKLVDFSG